MIFNKEKIELAKEILEVENRFYSPVFNLFTDEIGNLLKINLKYKTIYNLLKKELQTDNLNYKVFTRWIKKTFNLNDNKKTKTNTDISKNQTKTDVKKLTETVENLWMTKTDKGE